MNGIEHRQKRRLGVASVWKRLVAAACVAAAVIGGASAASAETRSLKLYYVHTREKAEIVFKRNGSYDQAGLKRLNQFLRDWRRNEPTKMDPRLFDLVWEAYKASGSNDYIHVISAYRSPATNSMLRSRSKGVAEKSQHMLGKAMDFYLPDVKLKNLRDIGLRMQVGGVGYYPRSGSPFVHLDVGNVRHWPKMSRKELVAVFPKGNTLHVPSDGKPLPGYENAVASYQARKKKGTTALALASAKPSKSGGLLATLFGGGADEEEDGAEEAAPAKPAVVKAAPKPAAPEAPLPGVGEAAAPAPAPIPVPPAEVEETQTPEAILAALPARDIPLPDFAPRPKADVGAATVASLPENVPFGIAEAGPANERFGTAEATPDNVPFGTAEATPDSVPFGMAEARPTIDADADEDEAYANVPLPTWRPDHAAPAEDGQVVLASAEAGMPTAAIPLPQNRPDAEEFTVAGVAVKQSPDDVIAAEVRANNERLAVLSKPASIKDAVVARPAGSDAAAFVTGSVKTTAKSARPSAQDTRPDPKPQVVAAVPATARWAIVGTTGTVAGSTASAPVAHHLVRSAPSEVYATGFQQGAEVADAGRFTGKAVSFIPVARFATN